MTRWGRIDDAEGAVGPLVPPAWRPGCANTRSGPRPHPAPLLFPAVVATSEQVVRLAARMISEGTRLDLNVVAQRLGISRATLFRRVGNREELMGEALWLLSDRTLAAAVRWWEERWGQAVRAPDGHLRCLAVMERYRDLIAGSLGLRRLLDEEPTVTIRVVTDPRGRVQPRMIEAYTALFERDVEALGLTSEVPLPLLSYAVVRLGESFLYSDVMVSREPDLKTAATVCDALVTGVLGLRAA